MNDKIKKTSLYVPSALWKKIRLLSFEKNTSANDLVVSALQEKYGDTEPQ
jgi:hypothetical protein